MGGYIPPEQYMEGRRPSWIDYHKGVQDECRYLQMIEKMKPMVMRYGVGA